MIYQVPKSSDLQARLTPARPGVNIPNHSPNRNGQSMDETTRLVDEVLDELDEEIDEEQLEEAASQLVEYEVPFADAKDSLVNQFSGRESVEEYPEKGVGDIEAQESENEEEWISVSVTVLDIWENDHDSVAQVGLVGDETGQCQFTIFSSSDLPHLEEGVSYHLSPVVASIYEGRTEIRLNNRTEIEELEQEISTGADTVELAGPIVDVKPGSGLIRRCAEGDCSLVLNDGECSEHGAVEGEWDLRIKAVLDTSESYHHLVFGTTETESVTGVSLSEAEGTGAAGADEILEEVTDAVVGKYYRITGTDLGSNIIVQDAERLERSRSDRASELLSEVAG